MKSRHIIYYVFDYDHVNMNRTSCNVTDDSYDNEWFYQNFTELFSNKRLIQTYCLDKYNGKNLILKNLEVDDINFKIDKTVVRLVPDYKVGMVELYFDNYDHDNFEDISRHIFKNESFSENDSFNGIFIEDQQIITSDTSFDKTEKYLNQVIFNNAVDGLKISTGRKNFQIFSLISSEYSQKVHDISSSNDLSIYRIATGERNMEIGPDTYKYFVDGVYDKWVHTGSLYIISSDIMLQILDPSMNGFSSVPLTKYNKIVTLALLQKVIFVKFQNVSSNLLKSNKFNFFVSKYYFIEVSHDNQSQSFYEMLQRQLKVDRYHAIVKEEINIVAESRTSNYLLVMTFLYTIFALISVLLMF